MTYDYSKEEFYEGWTLFSFTKDEQPIEVVFIPSTEVQDPTLYVVVWSDNGENIKKPHDITFHNTLNSIVSEFDNGRDFIYEIAVI